MKIKALGLISGGLDSYLAAKMVLDQGIEVEVIHFLTGFGIKQSDVYAGHVAEEDLSQSAAAHCAKKLGVPFICLDKSEEYMPVLTSPRYGYGANINPCIDCKIFMLSHAKHLLKERSAQFIFTGEVLGQRPMSQRRETLKWIEIDPGLAGMVLRPLSAQLLDPTIPEIKGWVDRTKLGAISGRSRKPQLELVRQWGLEYRPNPAGGCCHLINPDYAARLRDFFDHYGQAALNREEIILLNVGRHFRLTPDLKIIVGRNHTENEILKVNASGRHLFVPVDVPGAWAISDTKGPIGPELLSRIIGITARYSDSAPNQITRVSHHYNGAETILEIKTDKSIEVSGLRIDSGSGLRKKNKVGLDP